MAVDLEVLKRTAGPLEYELYLDGRFFQRHVAGDAAGAAAENAHVVEFQLPHGEKLLELWLPCSVPLMLGRWSSPVEETRETTLLSLETDGPSVSPVDDDRPVWICYGSSITHGGPSGSSASNSWPALLARAAHFKLLNLGFGGECYLDPAVAFVIRDAPCELITLEVGINIQTTAAMNKRTFPAAVYGFIHIIREKHRTVPIVVISPLRYEPLEARAPVGTSEFMSLQDRLPSLFSCVETLIELGDQNIFYCDGLELLHEPELFFDGLHPGPRGQRRIVERLWPTLRPLVGASTQEHFELPEELPSEANELTGAYVVDMPGEGRSRMVLQLHRSQLVALSERRDWPPAPLQRRDDFVFVLNMPGVWGQNAAALRERGWKLLTCDPKIVEPCYMHVLSTEATKDVLRNKGKLRTLAASLGLLSLLPQHFDFFSDATYPCILKPAIGTFGKNTYIVESKEQAMRLAPDGLDETWILQELITGELEYSTTLLVLDGKILDWAGMKYQYSMEAYVWPHVRLVDQELCSVPAEHRQLMEKFLVGFSGICNFNFKLREDGTMCIFEVNPRVGGDLAFDLPKPRARSLLEKMDAMAS
eukprot:g17185.t1